MSFSTALDSSRPKQSFLRILPGLINQYGQFISRKDLFSLKDTENVALPSLLRQCISGRGMYDLFMYRDRVEKLQNSADTVVHNLNHIGEAQHQLHLAELPVPKTDEELLTEINDKFYALSLVGNGVIKGKYRSLIISGEPGIGKTYLLEKKLREAAEESKILYTHKRGFVRATGLFKMMYDFREKDSVILLDDADSIFKDQIALSILKAALDTSKNSREISWLSEKKFETEAGEELPRSFEFNGSIIFITNIDFTRMIHQRNSDLAPHLKALMTRTMYVDLNLRNHRELIIHIRNVAKTSGLLQENGVSDIESQTIIMEYFEENVAKLREVSLRTLVHLCDIWNESDGDIRHFKIIANSTQIDPTRRH